MATKWSWSNKDTNNPGKTSGNTKKIGTKAEKFAQKLIRNYGLKLIATNVNYPFGEIDLIAEDAAELVFIEVRFRSNTSHGSALESVAHQKQKRLILAAQRWLKENQSYQNRYCRFDVIAIDSTIDTRHTNWQKNAFEVPDQN